jgi:exopolyphosphatase/pppGpp-phosphohydrolase
VILTEILPDLFEIEEIAITILPYVHSTRQMKYFTNHEKSHSQKVLKYINEIIDMCDLSGINLNEAEKSILRCACWLHDLGCIYDRKNHAKESVKIIEILCEKGHIDLKAIKNEVEKVVLTHSTKGLSKLKDIEEEKKIEGYPNRIRLRLLCVLFKLADECDIDRLRAPEAVYDILENKMPEYSKHWWKGHENVASVKFSIENKKILIIMSSKGDKEIAGSLKKTLEDERISKVLERYGFPCRECEIEYIKDEISECSIDK